MNKTKNLFTKSSPSVLIFLYKNNFQHNLVDDWQTYKISRNPFRKLIWIQKSIEFQLPHYSIPQLSSHYSWQYGNLWKS